MRVMVAFGHRFMRPPNGHIYTRGTVDYNFLSRYLAVFDKVIVLSRVEDVDEIPPDKNRADGPNVSIFPLPYYFGPMQSLKRGREVRTILTTLLQISVRSELRKVLTMQMKSILKSYSIRTRYLGSTLTLLRGMSKIPRHHLSWCGKYLMKDHTYGRTRKVFFFIPLKTVAWL
jgi:hypothetical protein